MSLPNKIVGVVNYSEVKGSVELREIELPKIGDNDVLLQVENVGVCGSDLHQWTSDHSWEVNYPVVLGHEFGGVIVQLGENVNGWKIGDRVVSETAAVIDSQNPMSKIGLYNLDPTRKGFGYGVNGAMTKYVSTPARCLHHIPDSLSFEEACLTEPCCVAYNAIVENSNVKPGDRVLVIGPGTIGILCAVISKICGAEVAILGLENDSKHKSKSTPATKPLLHKDLLGERRKNKWNYRQAVGMLTYLQATTRPSMYQIFNQPHVNT